MNSLLWSSAKLPAYLNIYPSFSPSVKWGLKYCPSSQRWIPPSRLLWMPSQLAFLRISLLLVPLPPPLSSISPSSWIIHLSLGSPLSKQNKQKLSKASLIPTAPLSAHFHTKISLKVLNRGLHEKSRLWWCQWDKGNMEHGQWVYF